MIKINEIKSLRDPESCEIIYDNRIEKIEVINGVAIQNYGHIQEGDAVSLVCVFKDTDYGKILALWESDTKVNFTDQAGSVWENMRLVLQRAKYLEKYPHYIEVTFELWRK